MNKVVEKLNNGNGMLHTISTIVAIIFTVAGGFWLVDSRQDDRTAAMNRRLTEFTMEVKDAFHAIDKRVSINETNLMHLPAEDRWRGQDQLIWAYRLREANKNNNLEVPDPSEIIRERVNND